MKTTDRRAALTMLEAGAICGIIGTVLIVMIETFIPWLHVAFTALVWPSSLLLTIHLMAKRRNTERLQLPPCTCSADPYCRCGDGLKLPRITPRRLCASRSPLPVAITRKGT